MADRFDLEEKIMRASWVLEDIRLLRDRYNQRDFTWNELDNFLMAMETIYQHRFDDLDDMMCQVFELNQYASKEVKAKRSPSFDIEREQPKMPKDKIDKFYQEVERDKKWKPGPDLQSTFDEKM